MPTEQEARQEALHQLAVLGGMMTAEDDIKFEGKRFIIPTSQRSLIQAVETLQLRIQSEEEITAFQRSFPFRPFDGAKATADAIRQAFGFTQGKTIQTFFGPRPPQMIDIAVDVDRTEQVPWGAMLIPGLDNTTVHLTEKRDPELGPVFHVVVEAPRKHRHVIEGLFKLVERNLKERSIYKGHAIDGAMQPNFLDVGSVDPANVVYTHEVMAQLEANVWSPIRHAELLGKLGQPGKRSVLLEGPYGTGKTLAALLTAQVAIANGWTFITCRPGRDDLLTTLQTARIYQPSVVFFEDLDTLAVSGQDTSVSTILDMFDGIQTKGLRMSLVMTTNHVEHIHKGMIRPGRLDAVVSIGSMDRDGVERLARRVIGDALEDVIDWDEVSEALDGFVPAFVKEALDRAIRYNIARNEGHLSSISCGDLVEAARGLRPQLDLMNGASDEARQPTMDKVFNTMIDSQLNGRQVLDSDGDPYWTIGVVAES